LSERAYEREGRVHGIFVEQIDDRPIGCVQPLIRQLTRVGRPEVVRDTPLSLTVEAQNELAGH
jgi:hypothetical protein